MSTKILYIIDKLAPGKGGTATSLIELIRLLDKQAFLPQVYALCGDNHGPHFDELKELGIPIRFLGLQRIYDVRALARFFVLARFIKEEKIDIVHTFLSSSNIYGILAGFVAGVKVRIASKREIEDWKNGGIFS